MKKILFMFALTALIAVGCEEKEDDKVNEAQKCLNEASAPADATACKDIIAGINNDKANQVRCALEVMENGITQQAIVDAFKALDSGTEDPVIEIATKIGLGDITDPADGDIDNEEITAAQGIKDTCYLTTSVGMKTISQLILFGTQAKSVTSGDYDDPADVANDINNMTDADAGTFANDVFDLYCVPTFSNEDICGTLSSAGAGSADAATVGAALKACLQNDTCN